MSREYSNPMSPTGTPPLRKVTANVLTDLGWLHGTFNLPRCIFAPYGEPEDSPKTRRLGSVVINLSAAIGVAERDSPE